MAGTLPMAADRAEARPGRRRVLLVAGAIGLLLAAGGVGLWAVNGVSPAPRRTTGETTPALRDRLLVSVTESGEIDARRSTNVVCEVEGQSTIIWVIEEGTIVKPGDKLVELDSAELQERVRAQDMTYKTARAAFEKAEQQYLITESTRESLLSAASLATKFALVDLRKYLGGDLADRIIAQEGHVDFPALVGDAALGGAALQEKRKLQADIGLSDQEVVRATEKVAWTRRLKDKGYVTGNELQADELALQRQQVLLDQARTALDLFLVYEFPKQAEKLLTDWTEAKREYDRVDARTKSDVAAAQADRDNKREAMRLEETRFKKVQDQLEKTTLKAPQAGMVVYETGSSRWGQQVIIEAGASARHQQTLFRLPDMSEMNVKVKLHESVVKQASEGAPAFITIDAMPKERLTGKVTKIAVMPDRGQMWLNPGLKTYVTEVTLDTAPTGLKPGMSAQVEILVDTRDNVLQVPVSAVFVDKGFQVVYVKKPGGGVETRRVEVGLSNDRMVEIAQGIEAGEDVYLFKPAGAEALKVADEELRAREEMERRLAAERERAARARGPNGAPAAAEGLTPEKMKALRERFEKMPPEERERVLKQMREAGVPVPGEAAPAAAPAGERPAGERSGGGSSGGGSSDGDRPPRRRPPTGGGPGGGPPPGGGRP